MNSNGRKEKSPLRSGLYRQGACNLGIRFSHVLDARLTRHEKPSINLKTSGIVLLHERVDELIHIPSFRNIAE
jgi:hypothetical protein